MIDFRTRPDRYRHWRLEVDGDIATLALDVDPTAPAIGDYELKLNSYDIGVDIELADAVRRIRFEHPGVRCVVLTSALEGTFCAGAHIRLLAGADHSHKGNFCKFTNETRLELEDAALESGIRFLAAVNGACSGGGYELALACEHILLVDDRNTAVSLPEVPLLGVLPGTGGLTRVTDKRHVRRDRADVFATKAEGFRGDEAVEWGLVDSLAPRTGFDESVTQRARQMIDDSTRTTHTPIELPAIQREVTEHSVAYEHVQVDLHPDTRHAELTVTVSPEPQWLLATALQLDDALCHLRFNEPELASVVLRTAGDPAAAATHDARLEAATSGESADWELRLLWGRVLSRLDLTAKTLIAAIEPGSCFVGFLAEIGLAADRSYMLDGRFEDDEEPLSPARIELSTLNFNSMLMANGIDRLTSRFWGNPGAVECAREAAGIPLDAQHAERAGLVTSIPDDLDWHDELRLAIEERASYSPDALTAMEANHRFCGPETMATKIFARLSAWQNWIFTRPNASGPDGALRRYGTGTRPSYDFRRT
ncbi:MAG: 2,3-epoxybenzoyl-CoA dihydrolase [Actinomycetota bacterium]|nr:2,3-epoxybenzoyl-CoA dihydrolase [Actinomycetota bacterium]